MAERNVRHIVGVNDLGSCEIKEELIPEAIRLRELGQNVPRFLNGNEVLGMFFEPSFNTDDSFRTVVKRAGGIYESKDHDFLRSWAAEVGELEDMATILNARGYYAALILAYHHPGGAEHAAGVLSNFPLINAGERRGPDGEGYIPEHPTQAFGDALKTWDSFGRLDHLRVAFVGSARHPHVNSTSRLFMMEEGTHIDFITVPGYDPERVLLDQLQAQNVCVRTDRKLKEVLPEVDIVYVTNIQNVGEKAGNSLYNGRYTINEEALALMQQDAIVMHPLPRRFELPRCVDADKRVVWLEQAIAGDYARMALLEMLVK